jgi:flagellar L-ring protein precursor FlgH
MKLRLASLALTLCLAGAWPAAAVDLYREGEYRPLTADARAFRVGDTLSVLVVETSSASSSADTGTRRNTDAALSGSVQTRSVDRRGEVTLAADNNFTGGARTARAGKLLAQIAVTVVGVEPNGDLRISGEQLLDVNDEQQRIRIEGRVRRNDIGESNSVVSSRIADARIYYSGEGVLAEGQRPGWITRVLRWLGL